MVRQNIKTSNTNMNTENVYCKSMVRKIWRNSQVIQGCSKDSFHKYLAAADVEVGNFKKIRFFPVKIEVIQRIVKHPTIHPSRNAFLSGG